MKRIGLLLIMLIIAPYLNAQYLVYPKISSDEITDLVFLNKNDAIYINSAGSIMKSTDGGRTWKLKKHYQSQTLLQIKFLDEKIGFIRQNDGLIYTLDGGESWNTHNISVGNAITFLPFSESVMLKTTTDGKIERLNNYYNTWETVYKAPTFMVPAGGCFPSREESYGNISKLIKFFSGRILAFGTNSNAKQNNVLTDSLSYILRSNDSGITWDTLWIGLTQIINDISFYDEQNGWMASEKDVYKTTDGGKNWEHFYLDGLSNNIYDLYVYDKENIWGITGWGTLTGEQFFRSTNGGSTWIINNIEPTHDDKLIVVDKQTGFCYGNKILMTENGGQLWKMVDSSIDADIFNISFSSKLNGFAVGGKYGQKFVYKTIDGGKSWGKNFIQEKSPRQIKIVGNNDGWLIAENKIYNTINSGKSWEEKIILTDNYTYDGIVCCNENLAMLYNVKDNLTEKYNNYVTTNGGQTWGKINVSSFGSADF